MAKLIFGIDLGIASCGWAVINAPTQENEMGQILAMGSWLFDAPETDKERTPKNQIRRQNRLLRRVIRRRAQRMAQIRQLFHEHGLLESHARDILGDGASQPWTLRAQALDICLTPYAWAKVLAHIAKRRGFKSSAKRKEKNSTSDDSKMLAATEATRERLGRYRTLGEMFVCDPEYAGRKRNRENIYDRTLLRDELLQEVKSLFQAQRRLGNPHASPDLEAAFIAIAFHQRPLQDSEKLLGYCPFVPTEKRAAKAAPSYELFRLATRLHNIRISNGISERPLTREEYNSLTADPGRQASMSITHVRKKLGLSSEEFIQGYKAEQEKQDITSRTGEAFSATYKLRKALGEEIWTQFAQQPALLDSIAHIISFFETHDKILQELSKLPISAEVQLRLKAALEADAFSSFKGAAHLSAQAMRAIIPHLLSGLGYDQACAAAGYDHSASRWSAHAQIQDKKSFRALLKAIADEMGSPVARKSLTEGMKQIWAMCNRWGLPDAIHLELARDVGNSLEQRNKIKKNLDETTAERERQRQDIRTLLHLEDVSGDTLLRYRLWKEQNGRCPYTDKAIPASAILATDNSFQVDHILPWSRFGDDSFNNKVLCASQANQAKKARTPYEWLLPTNGPEVWAHFVARIESNPHFKGMKKRNYLLKDAASAEERFRTRNLNDTRYATRLMAEAVKLLYPKGERSERGAIRRVYTRPGALTATLRQAWGLESLKKVDGKRVEDARHHALDALVVAAVSEWEVQKLTREYQKWKEEGMVRSLRQVSPPWADSQNFRQQVQKAYAEIVVAKAERRRARGKGHDATIRQVRERDGQHIVYERKSIMDIKESDLDRVKDAERNQAMIAAIRDWIARGKPAHDLPKVPAGHDIRKIRLRTTGKIAVPVRGGTADRGSMVRVDVFSKANKRGKEEFYLIPIYTHQIMNKRDWPTPPQYAVAGGKAENIGWTEIDDSYAFKFSLYAGSFVELVKPDGLILSGYFNSLDRATGAINLANPKNSRLLKDNHGNPMRSIGVKSLHRLSKYSINRFGEKFEVQSEMRTWHGVACTSPSRPS